jgi:hypothetical protein
MIGNPQQNIDFSVFYAEECKMTWKAEFDLDGVVSFEDNKLSWFTKNQSLDNTSHEIKVAAFSPSG